MQDKVITNLKFYVGVFLVFLFIPLLFYGNLYTNSYGNIDLLKTLREYMIVLAFSSVLTFIFILIKNKTLKIISGTLISILAAVYYWPGRGSFDFSGLEIFILESVALFIFTFLENNKQKWANPIFYGGLAIIVLLNLVEAFL